MAYDMGAELASTGVTAVSLWLGLIRTPLLLGSGLTEFAGFPVSRAEDPASSGGSSRHRPTILDYPR